MGFIVSDIKHARKWPVFPASWFSLFSTLDSFFSFPFLVSQTPYHLTSPLSSSTIFTSLSDFQSETCASSLFCQNFLSWNLTSLPSPPMGSFPQHLLPPTMGQEALAGNGTSSLPDDQGETEKKRRSFTPAGAQKEPNPCYPIFPWLCAWSPKHR